MEEPVVEIRPEQLRFAAVVRWCTFAGVTLALGAFALYVAGLLPGSRPLDRMPLAWSGTAQQYLASVGLAPGWSWVRRIAQGDFASLAGVVVLIATGGVAVAAVTPIFVRRRDRVYVAICLLALAVMAFAAAGILPTSR